MHLDKAIRARHTGFQIVQAGHPAMLLHRLHDQRPLMIGQFAIHQHVHRAAANVPGAAQQDQGNTQTHHPVQPPPTDQIGNPKGQQHHQIDPQIGLIVQGIGLNRHRMGLVIDPPLQQHQPTGQHAGRRHHRHPHPNMTKRHRVGQLMHRLHRDQHAGTNHKARLRQGGNRLRLTMAKAMLLIGGGGGGANRPKGHGGGHQIQQRIGQTGQHANRIG